jgi:hypothetical protein
MSDSSDAPSWEEDSAFPTAELSSGAGRRLVEAFAADFELHGRAAIKHVRENDPKTYLRICATVLAREAGTDDGPNFVELLRDLDRIDPPGGQGRQRTPPGVAP